jgi:hypothetical protein
MVLRGIETSDQPLVNGAKENWIYPTSLWVEYAGKWDKDVFGGIRFGKKLFMLHSVSQSL